MPTLITPDELISVEATEGDTVEVNAELTSLSTNLEASGIVASGGFKVTDRDSALALRRPRN